MEETNMKKLTIAGLTAAGLGIALGLSQAQTATAPLELRVNLRVGNAPLELGKMYKTPGGLDYQVDLLKFYVSNVTLVKADGGLVPVAGLSLAEFKGAGAMAGGGHGGSAGSSGSMASSMDMMPGGMMMSATGTQDAVVFKGNAPVGEYRGVRFDVGVPRELNNQDASLQKMPLGVESSMFWAWNPGYIFYRFEGKTMISGKAEPFLLHMGTDAYRMPVGLFDLQKPGVKVNITAQGGAARINLNAAKVFERGPNSNAPWDLTNKDLRVMHGGPHVGQAYLNLLGAWGLAQ
jgi:hypothetical protein